MDYRGVAARHVQVRRLLTLSMLVACGGRAPIPAPTAPTAPTAPVAVPAAPLPEAPPVATVESPPVATTPPEPPPPSTPSWSPSYEPAPSVPRATHASPPPPPPPVEKDWCVSSHRGHELFADGRGVVVCHRHWEPSQAIGPECARLDLVGGKPKPVARPPTPSYPSATVRDHEVCVPGGTCTAFGPNLRAEVREARAGKLGVGHEPLFDATLDGRVVVVAGRPWNVVADRHLALAPAGTYAKHPKGAMVSATVVENLLVNDWYACAGPCHQVQLTSSSGVPIGPVLAGYPHLIRASADLFVLGADGSPDTGDAKARRDPPQLHVLDVRTGARRMTITPPLGVDTAVALGGDLLVLRGDKLQRLAGGRKTAEWKLPSCPDG